MLYLHTSYRKKKIEKFRCSSDYSFKIPKTRSFQQGVVISSEMICWEPCGIKENSFSLLSFNFLKFFLQKALSPEQERETEWLNSSVVLPGTSVHPWCIWPHPLWHYMQSLYLHSALYPPDPQQSSSIQGASFHLRVEFYSHRNLVLFLT